MRCKVVEKTGKIGVGEETWRKKKGGKSKKEGCVNNNNNNRVLSAPGFQSSSKHLAASSAERETGK
jgi:hypothetical protein